MDYFFFYFMYYGKYIVYGIIILLIIKFIFTKSIKDYHSRWNTLIDEFEYSPKEFYKLLQAELKSHGITRMEITESHKGEGSIIAPSRLYLTVKWRNYKYDVCAAKFGNGFFISWWLIYKDSIGKIMVAKIPFVGTWLSRKLFPITYYRMDSASMFMAYAQKSVLKIVKDITENKGVRAMTEDERKPILNTADIFRR